MTKTQYYLFKKLKKIDRLKYKRNKLIEEKCNYVDKMETRIERYDQKIFNLIVRKK